MKKRGMTAGLMFTSVLTIIILGLVLLFGFRMVGDLGGRADETQLLFIEKEIARDTTSLAGEYGSSKKKEYDIPSKVAEICFVDLDHSASIGLLERYPLVADSVDSGTGDNLFLMGYDGLLISSTNIGKLRVSGPHYICYDTSDSRLEFFLEGIAGGATGIGEHFSNSAYVDGTEEVTLTIDAVPGLKVIFPTDIGLIDGPITFTLSVLHNDEGGASDNFVITPLGMKIPGNFTKPIILHLPLGPNENCQEYLAADIPFTDGTTEFRPIECSGENSLIYYLDQTI